MLFCRWLLKDIKLENVVISFYLRRVIGSFVENENEEIKLGVERLFMRFLYF